MATRTGFYINLDRSPERREFMENQIQTLGLDWVRRFAAVDGALLQRPGDARGLGIQGSFLSHLRVLEQAPEDAFTFIFEDDMDLSPDLAGLLTVENLAGSAGHDIVFLDCQMYCETAQLRRCWEALKFGLINEREAHDVNASRRAWRISTYAARGMYTWGAAAYVVTPKGRKMLIDAMRLHWESGEALAADMFYLRLMMADKLNAVVFMPFLASPVPTDRLASVVDHAGGNRGLSLESEALSNVIRRLFYAGPVPDVLAACQASGIPADANTDAADLLASLSARHLRNSLDDI